MQYSDVADILSEFKARTDHDDIESSILDIMGVEDLTMIPSELLQSISRSAITFAVDSYVDNGGYRNVIASGLASNSPRQ